jgi:hypothetical protein
LSRDWLFHVPVTRTSILSQRIVDAFTAIECASCFSALGMIETDGIPLY